MTRTCAKVNNVLWDQLYVHFLPPTGFIPDSLKHFLFVHELLSRNRDAIPPEYPHILNNHIFMQKVTLTDWMSSESFTHMRSRMRCRREKMISGFLSPSSPAVSDSNRQSCLVSVFTSNKTREGGGGRGNDICYPKGVFETRGQSSPKRLPLRSETKHRIQCRCDSPPPTVRACA